MANSNSNHVNESIKMPKICKEMEISSIRATNNMKQFPKRYNPNKNKVLKSELLLPYRGKKCWGFI